MVFHWSLFDSKSSQVCRTLLNILAGLNNEVVWMVSTRPLIYQSSTPFNNLSVTVSRTPITISINVILMFHSFFNSQARSRYLYLFSLSFHFTLWSTEKAKSTILQVIIIIIIYSFRVFHISISWWFFTGVLSDSKSPQVSGTLLYSDRSQ